MSGHQSFENIKRKERPPESETRIERLRDIYEHVFGLGTLRERRGLSQVQVASGMGVSQANISRFEHSTDVYLSTVERYVEALGGQVRLVADFADQSIELPLTPTAWNARPIAQEPEDGDSVQRVAG